MATRKPLPCLAFVLPLLVAYEVGVNILGGPSADALRAGADAWIRQGLAAFGLTDRWLLPIALVSGLLGWQALDRRDWRFPPMVLVGMLIESLTLAVALVGLSKLVDLGFSRLEGPGILAAGPPASRHPIAPVVGFLGAGLYEEALFRLALIPLLYRSMRLVLIPPLAACTLAITASSLLFSLAHHAGAPGEAFTWFAFIFRWLAGVFFAWVFVVRGFGVAVGTHTAYDLLVGWFDWHL
jgi:membrane protease YdiL (CAAX protease family)